MITAIVLLECEVDSVPEVAEELAELDGVAEVYSVTGSVDLIAIVRVSRHEDLAEIIPHRVGKVSGVVSTDTHIAFRAYSKHDLEAAFSLGTAG